MPTHNHKEEPEGVLVDTARSIGTALGTLSARAGELTDNITETVTNIHMPTLPTADEAVAGAKSAVTGAKKAVTRLFSRKKKKPAAKAAAPKGKKKPATAKKKFKPAAKKPVKKKKKK